MTETRARIRWADESPQEYVTLAGRTGTRNEPAFRIFGPDAVNERWLLSVRLAAGSEFIYGDGPDKLKAEAERWLSEFISSLGAFFLADIEPATANNAPSPSAPRTEEG